MLHGERLIRFFEHRDGHFAAAKVIGKVVELNEEALAQVAGGDADGVKPLDALEHLFDVELAVAPDAYRRLLPPSTRAAAQPRLRLLAASIGRNALSPVGYNEVWLMAPVVFEGEEVWFALSHLVSPGGDVITGRETFGWPTKMAEQIVIRRLGSALDLSIVRLHRQVLAGRARLAGRPGAGREERLTVLGVQPIGSPIEGADSRYVTQPWAVEFARVSRVDPRSVTLGFPAGRSPGLIGRSDAWHQFAGAPVMSASFGRGTIRRYPGAVRSAGLRPDIIPYLSDRNDAYAGQQPIDSSFLVRT